MDQHDDHSDGQHGNGVEIASGADEGKQWHTYRRYLSPYQCSVGSRQFPDFRTGNERIPPNWERANDAEGGYRE